MFPRSRPRCQFGKKWRTLQFVLPLPTGGAACLQGGKRISLGSYGGHFISQPIPEDIEALEAALRNRPAKLRNGFPLKILFAADIDDVGLTVARKLKTEIPTKRRTAVPVVGNTGLSPARWTKSKLSRHSGRIPTCIIRREMVVGHSPSSRHFHKNPSTCNVCQSSGDCRDCRGTGQR